MSGAIGATNSSQTIKTDYLNLLITQMRNQNPLEPLNNNEMATQLAMFSQLEQLENQSTQLSGISTSFDTVLQSVQRSQAAGLIDKEISFLAPEDESGGTNKIISGKVDSVTMVDGQPVLTVGEYAVGLDAIISVSK